MGSVRTLFFKIHPRLKADIRQYAGMLLCGPSNQPYTASAKSRHLQRLATRSLQPSEFFTPKDPSQPKAAIGLKCGQ